MVYFGKKQIGNYYNKSESDSRYARKTAANTFTQNNTFEAQVGIKSRLEFYEAQAFNDYTIRFQADAKGSGNFDMIRLHKAGRKWGINYNIDSQKITIDGAYQTAITNLANPTGTNHAVNMGYVDNFIKDKVITLSDAQYKNNINSNKCRIYGFTDSLTTAQKNNVLGIELFANQNWNDNGTNTYLLNFCKYNGDELKVIITRADGQAITSTELDAYQIKIRYAKLINEA